MLAVGWLTIQQVAEGVLHAGATLQAVNKSNAQLMARCWLNYVPKYDRKSPTPKNLCLCLCKHRDPSSLLASSDTPTSRRPGEGEWEEEPTVGSVNHENSSVADPRPQPIFRPRAFAAHALRGEDPLARPPEQSDVRQTLDTQVQARQLDRYAR